MQNWAEVVSKYSLFWATNQDCAYLLYVGLTAYSSNV